MTRLSLSTQCANAISDRMNLGPIARAYLTDGLTTWSMARLQAIMLAIETDRKCECWACRLAMVIRVKWCKGVK